MFAEENEKDMDMDVARTKEALVSLLVIKMVELENNSSSHLTGGRCRQGTGCPQDGGSSKSQAPRPCGGEGGHEEAHQEGRQGSPSQAARPLPEESRQEARKLSGSQWTQRQRQEDQEAAQLLGGAASGRLPVGRQGRDGTGGRHGRSARRLRCHLQLLAFREEKLLCR